LLARGHGGDDARIGLAAPPAGLAVTPATTKRRAIPYARGMTKKKTQQQLQQLPAEALRRVVGGNAFKPGNPVFNVYTPSAPQPSGSTQSS
jgi:hypothetical protein